MKLLKGARVLVVGDSLLDTYWYGDTLRVSPEAPVPVVKVDTSLYKAGGAGNVALNIAHLQGYVSLVTVVGDDEYAACLEEQLQHPHITTHALRVPQPTIRKLRIMSQDQHMLRVDFEKEYCVEEAKLLALCTPLFSQVGALLLSDYGKGTLRNPQALITWARRHHLPVLIDPKGRDFSRYQGATLITPNYKEFTDVVGPCETTTLLVKRARELIKTYALESLLITHGAEGMIWVSKTRHVSVAARAQAVFDVTGAGDTVIAVMAMGLSCGLDPTTSMTYANAAAGIVVSKLGSASVSLGELKEELALDQEGLFTQEEALNTVQNTKAQGRVVVMTNGCFDLLHAGHVRYLQKAKALGHFLLVALNDDASVTRLKGTNRPLVPLKQRMWVVAALGCVDGVVSFSEDTPEALIEKIGPDILVKGDDYSVHQIAGASSVLASGGQVLTVPLEKGCSTTALIEKLHKKEER